MYDGLFFPRVVQSVFPPAATSYALLPIISGSGELPTPSAVNGIPDVEWPRSIYSYLYVHYSINAFIVLFYVLAEETFFFFNVLILSNRFATITDILRLLNYSGERDRAKDQRILKDSYILHLEVLK